MCPEGGIAPWVVWLGSAMVMILSVASWAGWCTEGCSETHKYRFYGLPFPVSGIAYSVALAVSFSLRTRKAARVVLAAAMSMAAGAELSFLYFQKFVIGSWCKVCLGVAFAVYLPALSWAYRGVREEFGSGGRSKVSSATRVFMKAVAVMSLVMFSSFFSLLGIAKAEKRQEAGIEPYYMGNISSDLEVYIITDWFCPACKMVEPEIVRSYPDISKVAKVVFVDYAIHTETLNYIPYNLSFILQEKEKYIQIRKALLSLAEKNKEPTPDDVQAAVAPLGVKYRQLNYADVTKGMKFFEDVRKTFKVDSTPTVVVGNASTKRVKVLSGTRDIRRDAIFAALADLSGK